MSDAAWIDYYASCKDMVAVFCALDDAVGSMMLARDEHLSGNHAAAQSIIQACLSRLQREAES